MIDISILLALLLLLLAGTVLAALQLPGTWLILAAAFGYDAYYHWQRLGWVWLVVLAVIAGIAEIIEILSSMLTARKAGASRRAAFGSLVGGFVGMLMFSIPVPVAGTIIGGLLGCFLGALLGEMTVRDDLVAGARVGLFAAVGRLLGLIAKTSAAMIMGGLVVVLALS